MTWVSDIAADTVPSERNAKRVRVGRIWQSGICGGMKRGKDANSSERDWFVIHPSAAGTDGQRGGNRRRVSKPWTWATTHRRRRAVASMTDRGRTETPTAAAAAALVCLSRTVSDYRAAVRACMRVSSIEAGRGVA